MDTHLLNKIAGRLALALLAASMIAPPAHAGHVKARGRVWYKNIRRDHQYTHAPDYGDSGVAAASYSSSYGRGREWWEFSGNQYVQRNWTSSYAQGSKYSGLGEAWHSNFLRPSGGSGDGPSGPFPGLIGTQATFEVAYRDPVPGTRNIEASPESMLSIRVSDLESDDPDAESKIRFVIDGATSEASLRVSMASGSLEVIPHVTGVFNLMQPKVQLEGGVAMMTFGNRFFDVAGSPASETLIDSMARVGDALPSEHTLSGTLDLGPVDSAWATGLVFEWELLSGTEVADSGTFHCNSALGFTLTALANGGPYTLRIGGRPYLTKSTPNVSFDGTAVQVALTSGDIDGDNSVTVFDYSVLSDSFDKSSADADWNSVGGSGFAPRDADLDGDGSITVFDYSILSDAFDRTGD